MASQGNLEFEARFVARIKMRAATFLMTIFYAILRWISYGMAVLALAASVGLLIGDAGAGTLPRFSAAVTSAAPLLLVGTSFLFMQPVIRPRLVELLKNVLLAATFLLWGIVQFMPQNAMSLRLGNLVIALYVLDLAWMTLGAVKSRERN
jgi:hypothetical protein